MSLYNHCGIYAIKNKITGEVYVGKTSNNFGDRRDCHKAMLNGGYHDNQNLQTAWNNYGEDCFDFVVLHQCDGKSLGEINQLEIEEIKKAKELNIAYNLHDGGDTGYYLGKHLSEEAKRKIGEKNRINMLGRKASEETKKKMSESHKRRYEMWSDEERAEWGKKMSEAQLGKPKPSLKETMLGNKNGAKYSVEQVREIRRLHEEEGKTISEISSIMGIKRPTVYLIATYRRWKEV